MLFLCRSFVVEELGYKLGSILIAGVLWAEQFGVSDLLVYSMGSY